MRKKNIFKLNTLLNALISAGLVFSPTFAYSQNNEKVAQNSDPVEETIKNDEPAEIISIIGSRVNSRTVVSSPVPVDIISSEQMSTVGGSVDMTDTLRTFIPSYTATPLSGDGSAFVRPTSLRGLAGDQALVMVNGKRRHRSASIQFNGAAANNGSHAPDVGMIPSIALKNVQVLRDGAAAQYGSDAIAGVVNFQLKDGVDEGLFVAQYGQHYEGETNYNFAANYGFSIGDNGFINASAEYIDNAALSRGVQVANAQKLINADVSGIGQDSPFDDAPLAQTWGRPESSGLRLFINSEYELQGGAALYAFGNYANTTARTRFFYRQPENTSAGVSLHGHIQNFLDNNPQFDENPFPAGYTPYFDGDQIDKSIVTGIKGELDNEVYYDISVGYGSNEIAYSLYNTIFRGPIEGTNIQRDFDVGGYKQQEINFNADFSKSLTDNISLAYGFELRKESFSSVAGETAAVQGPWSTSGFRATTASEAISEDRSNVSVYLDIEHDVTDDLLVQYALRYEDFSDFGSTLNGKLAANFALNDTVSIRSSVSTGFHAPTPGQSNITAINTTILTNGSGDTVLVDEGLVRPDSDEAMSVGGGPLQEETSVSFSLGFVAKTDFGTFTIDGYQIEVDDRIYRTENITTPDGLNIGFFTNGMDIRSSGIDVIYTNHFVLSDNLDTHITFAYNYGKIEVTDTVEFNGVSPIDPLKVQDIENNFPNQRFNLTANTSIGDNADLMLRANYYGKHFDERGEIGVPGGSFEIPALTSIDVEFSYHLSDMTTVSIGASNLLDEYPPEITAESGYANRESVGLLYPRRTPFGYDGGSWYLRYKQQF